MKRLLITGLTVLFLMGCVSAPSKKDTVKSKKVKPEIVQELEILDENNYIDIDDSTVKFLFKAKKGDLVNLYIGTEKNNLEMVQTEVLAGSRGILANGLTPDTEYFYQIESVRGIDSVKTDILSFTKQGNTNNWKAAEWARSVVFYEIFVRSFSDGNGDGIGDFIGLKNKIPYLKELGVEALWLMPINQSPSYHGYDVIDYYDVEKDYGTKEDFQSLLKEAHDNGIKIIIDMVINHSSVEHPWFKDAVSDVNSEYRDYYDWADSTDNIKKNGPFGGNMWHKKSTGYYNGIFWSGMPDLNLRNVEVREKFKDIASFWLDPNGDGDFSDGVDGFRLDAALHIDSEDKDVSHNWWQEFNTHVKSVNPNALLVGENWASTNKMASFFEDLDASFNFSYANNIIKMSKGKDVKLLSVLEGIHSAYKRYSDDFIDATFITNHDQDRIASVVGGDIQKSKFAGSILLTLPGTPFLYYGEELGQLGKKPDENIREPMDWYKDAVGDGMTTMDKGGFNNSMAYTKASDNISYEEQAGVDGSILEHYKKLIKIRKTYPEFFGSENYTLVDILKDTYSYEVSVTGSKILVIHNNKEESKDFPVTVDSTDLLTDTEYLSGDIIDIQAFSSLILKVTK